MAFQAFATVEDLQLGWKALPEDELPAAGELLMRASAQLASMLASHGIGIDPDDELQALNLKTVTCNMVRRSMGSGGADGMSSLSQTIGSTSASVSWSNPDGAFYLSKLDRQTLGIGGGRVGWAPLGGGGDAS